MNKNTTLTVLKVLFTCLLLLICIFLLSNIYRKTILSSEKTIENFYELSDVQKKILVNLETKNTNASSIKELLNQTKQDYDSLKNNYIENNQKFLEDVKKTLTKVDSINLTLDDEIEYVKSKLNGLQIIPVKKLKDEPEATKYPVDVLSSVLPIKTYNPPTSSPTSQPTPSSTSLPTSQPTTSSTSSTSLSPTSQPTSSSTSQLTPSPTSSLSMFQDILNSNPPKIPVEKFEDDWRSSWNTKISQIPDSVRTLNDMNPYISDEATKFYFVQNPKLEENLNNISSDIILLNMKQLNDSLRNKWITNYNKIK